MIESSELEAIYDVYPVTKVGKNTFFQGLDLDMLHNQEYFVTVIGKLVILSVTRASFLFSLIITGFTMCHLKRVPFECTKKTFLLLKCVT